MLNKLNQKIAILVTNIVGSMYCAYIFAALALVSFPASLETHNVVTIVAWIAQTFLQLVLLSVIMVGQNIQSKKSEDNLQLILQRLIDYQEKELTELENDSSILNDEKKILEKEESILEKI